MITEGLTFMSTDAHRTISRGNCSVRLPEMCFAAASLTAMLGISLGIYMGVSQDHQLAPVHVHLNLLGWVSLFLMGLYYKSHDAGRGWAAFLQAGIFAAGYLVMMAGVAGMILASYPRFLPVAVAGSLMVWAGFAMFAAIVIRTGFGLSRDTPQPRA
jgi:hypothetical protein